MSKKQAGRVVSTADGLPYYSFRKGEISWENFLKNFTEVIKLKAISSPLTPSDLADIFAEIERKELRVETVLLNAKTFCDMRKWGRDILDLEKRKKELQKGLMAMVWGAYIIINKNVPDGTVLVTSEEDKKVSACLKLDQEEYYSLNGINDLKEEAAELHRRLNEVYNKMEEMIDRTLSIPNLKNIK